MRARSESQTPLRISAVILVMCSLLARSLARSATITTVLFRVPGLAPSLSRFWPAR